MQRDEAVLRTRSLTSQLASLLPPRVGFAEVCVHEGGTFTTATPVIFTDLNAFLYLWLRLLLPFTAQEPISFTQRIEEAYRRLFYLKYEKKN